MQEFRHVIQNSQGIYADLADCLVKAARDYESQMQLSKRGQKGDLKHIFSVVALGIQTGDEVVVTIDGPDEEEAYKEMKELFKQQF